jgi:hypothetical protein
VEHVLRDESADIFDGLVIDTQLGPGGHRFVDAAEVAEIRTDAVVLTLSAADVERLRDPEPGPGVMEHHGGGHGEPGRAQAAPRLGAHLGQGPRALAVRR